jgi:hypothetical protein
MTGQEQNYQDRRASKVTRHICQREMRSTSPGRHLARTDRVLPSQVQQLPKRLFAITYEKHCIAIPPVRTQKVNCPV